MVLIDPAAMTAFWEQEVQMRIVQDIRDQLELDGLTTFESFADYTKDDLSAMRKRISYIQDIPHFGQDSFKRLVIAFEASRNYKLVGREITAAMMHYENTLKHFAEDWKTIVALEGRPEPPVPTICRALPPMKWVSAFVIADYQVSKIWNHFVLCDSTRGSARTPCTSIGREQSLCSSVWFSLG